MPDANTPADRDDPTDPSDAVDRILLAEAMPALATAQVVVIIGDDSGGLAGLVHAAAGSGPARQLRLHHDSATGARTARRLIAGRGVPVEFFEQLDAHLLSDADVVLLRLPKALAELQVIAQAVTSSAPAGVQLFGGGRVKHMSRGMNAVLEKYFGSVHASLGQQKSRVLVATDPLRTDQESAPRQQRHEDLGITVCAYGGTFAGADVDLGSRFLLGCFDRLPREATTVVDLGSGSGVLGVRAALDLPAATVTGVDDSSDAVRSTAATAEANGVADRVVAVQAERLHAMADGSVDLVVCNPPFHRGTARDSGAAYAMFADTARVLRPGGELWVVFNSHLPYLTVLRRVVGRTTVQAQNPRFTVARAVRRGATA
ncbi:MAG TPA: methyltransferase [Propionibacteriaceae bacterium]